MLSSFFPFLYGIAVLVLLWQAFRVMGRGFGADQVWRTSQAKQTNTNEDRTGKLTVHPELLDQDGRITDEELLTVRFSGDTDPPHSTEASAE